MRGHLQRSIRGAGVKLQQMFVVRKVLTLL